MGIHKCVHRLQNNCVTLEMMEGHSIVSTGFWSKFFQFCFLFFNCFKLFSMFCLIVVNLKLITLKICLYIRFLIEQIKTLHFLYIFNLKFDNFKHYIYCVRVHYCVLVLCLVSWSCNCSNVFPHLPGEGC